MVDFLVPRWSSLVVHRLIYILLRVTEFFYFPVVAVGLGAVFQGGDTVGIIVGIVLVVVFGPSSLLASPPNLVVSSLGLISALLVPVGATVVTLKTPLSELLVDGGKFRFFAFYGQMKPVHRKYTALPWVKKLLIGIGFAVGASAHLILPLAGTL